MLMLQPNRKKSNHILSLIISLVLTGLALLIIINRQYIVDQIIVWQFKPTSEVIALVDRSGMNDYGKFVYLASKPELDSSKSFNAACNRIENSTSILGCYSELRIYLYNVTDPQLDGIREVTATHETLHAIYVRLSSTEKTKVDALLEIEYKKLASDQSFKTLMQYYERSEPGQRDNELHSLIGTEVANISPELETYYQKYFTDRKKVIALDEKYSGVFKNLSDRATALVAQLNAMASSISVNTVQYNSEAVTLNGDILTFNDRANNGYFSSMSQFNSARSILSNRVDTLEALRTSISNDNAKYNTMLTEYNSISSESQKLYNSIDSTLVSAPSV